MSQHKEETVKKQKQPQNKEKWFEVQNRNKETYKKNFKWSIIQS
jgi:hypothetical protein